MSRREFQAWNYKTKQKDILKEMKEASSPVVKQKWFRERAVPYRQLHLWASTWLSRTMLKCRQSQLCLS